MSDRKASLLNNSQREFLQTPGASGDSKHARQFRGKIRERVREGIRDIELLVEASSQDRIDISALMSPNEGKTEGQKSEDNSEAPPTWPLVSLLFAWTEGHKITPNSLFSDGPEHGPTDEMEQRTRMFDLQVEQGTRRAFEVDPPDRVVNEVENKLEVSLGPELSGLDNIDLAAFPKHILDQLLRAGEISREQYADIYQERVQRIEAGKLDPRPPIGKVNAEDIKNVGDLTAYLDMAQREREQSVGQTVPTERDNGGDDTQD